jgi:ubiquinone/menaquinone biosynthesis C-methylase UbiE
LPTEDPHLTALTNRLDDLLERPEERPPKEPEPVLPDPGAIFKFSELGHREFEQAMDQFWANGGSRYESRRDRVYYQEIDRSINDLIGTAGAKKALDVACGIGRCGQLLSPDSEVVGVDVSSIAVEMARERHCDRQNFTFEHTDAHN